MIEYREATSKDFNSIAQLSAQSFGKYPYFDCAFHHAFKTDAAYSSYMEKLHRINIKANAPQKSALWAFKMVKSSRRPCFKIPPKRRRMQRIM